MPDASDRYRTRRLLLRHAKAADPGGVPDRDRELAPRGLRDAAGVGEHLASAYGQLDLVSCSPARRTRQTWTVAADAGASAAEVRFDELLYNADPATVLAVIAGVGDRVRSLLVVGHAPGIPSLTSELVGAPGGARGAQPGGDVEAYQRLAEGFPTAGLAVLSFTGDWSGLGPDRAELADFVVPGGS